MATFGYTTIGVGGNENMGTGTVAGTIFATPQGGLVTGFTAYTFNFSGVQSIKVLLFSVLGTAMTLIATSNAVANDTTPQWRDYPLASPVNVIAGGSYSLGLVSEGSSGGIVFDTAPVAMWLSSNGTYSYASPGNTTINSRLNRLLSIYATYTPNIEAFNMQIT